MTHSPDRPTAEKGRPTEETKTSRAAKGDLGAPEIRGRTTIADSVAEKIAGMATREVPGIHNLGSGMARTIGGRP